MSTNAIKVRDASQKEFIALFEKLAERYGRFDVWSDFVVMSAVAISNSVDLHFRENREQEYKERIGKYAPEESRIFGEMLAQVMMGLNEHPDQDYLGTVFSALHLHNEWKGQFFTPYHIAVLMAQINIPKDPDDWKSKSTVTVSDPACGAGCLMIAYANELEKVFPGAKRKTVFYAQDIDRIAGLMAYIQLSLLGCRAVVKIGNSLLNPFTKNEPITENIWLTPMECFPFLFEITAKSASVKEE